LKVLGCFFSMFTKFYALFVIIQMCFTREAFKLERASQRSAELDCRSWVNSMKIVLWTFITVCSLLLQKPLCHLSLFYLSPSLFQKSLPFLFVKPQSIFLFLYADTALQQNGIRFAHLSCWVLLPWAKFAFYVWGANPPLRSRCSLIQLKTYFNHFGALETASGDITFCVVVDVWVTLLD